MFTGRPRLSRATGVRLVSATEVTAVTWVKQLEMYRPLLRATSGLPSWVRAEAGAGGGEPARRRF